MSAVAVDRGQIEQLVRRILGSAGAAKPDGPAGRPNLVANISARHCHLTQEHAEALFGKGHTLTPMKYLYQEGEFAAQEVVTIIGPRQRMIGQVRVLGPTRKATQVELSFTDGIALGIELPVRISGDHRDTPGCHLMGPAGLIQLPQGVIRAERHVHMSPADAAYYGVKAGDRINMRIDGRCPTVLEKLVCRVDPNFKLEVHIDTDEGNACDLAHATRVELFR